MRTETVFIEVPGGMTWRLRLLPDSGKTLAGWYAVRERGGAVPGQWIRHPDFFAAPDIGDYIAHVQFRTWARTRGMREEQAPVV